LIPTPKNDNKEAAIITNILLQLNIKQRMHVRFFCKLGYLNFKYNKNSVSLSVSWPHGLNLSQYSPDSCLYILRLLLQSNII